MKFTYRNNITYTLIILTIFVFANINAQQIKFKHLTVENGLSQSVVNCMIEDHTGFLWFGTEDGLNRFDGYSFRIFRNIPGDSNSLSDNNIWSLFEDSTGLIWIGTQDGILNCFNPESEKFKHFKINSDNSLSGNSITCTYRDGDGLLWIGSYKGGLYRLNIKSGAVSNWQNIPGDTSSLSNKFVTSVYEDLRGNLWVGTYNGLCLFNKNSAEHPFICFYNNPSNINSLSDNIIWKIFPSTSDSDHIWIATYDGLTYLNTITRHFIQIIPDKNNPDKFSRSISSICEDNYGKHKILWLGTYQGLVKLRLPDLNTDPFQCEKTDSILNSNKNNLVFNRWINKSGNIYSINNNHINKILIDHSGVLWIAGQKGIDYYPKHKDKFNFLGLHKYEAIDFEKFNLTNVQAICETGNNNICIGTSAGLFILSNSSDKAVLQKYTGLSNQNIWALDSGNNNDVWIGTYGNGLEHLDLNSKKIRTWSGDWFDSANIANSYVRAVCKDKTGAVWIGMWGVGLNRLDPESGRIKRWHHDNNNSESLSYDDVWVIYEDSHDRIWIGTYGGGLNLASQQAGIYDSDDGGVFYNWQHKPDNPESLSNNNILSICESHINETKDKTILWIGTTNGLNKFIINNSSSVKTKPEVKIEHYLVQKNNITNTINSIVEDDNGDLWITTNKGLIKFSPVKGILDTYTIYDGLPGNEFNPNSALKTNTREIFLGSVNGLNIFYPDSIYHSDFKPKVILTEFQIFNQNIPLGFDSPLKVSINNSKEIILSFDQNVFSFQFSSLDYNAPETNQYAYMMEGFDKNWIYSGTRRFVTYTNLFPGTYNFKVKATNSDGVWNNSPTQIAIIITPPFWETWWFRGLMILFLLGILYSIYRFRLNRLLDLERLRIKIASDLHDDIGSALTRISMESELLNSNINPGGNKEGLARIGAMSREIISSMSDVVWSIDSRNDSIENLINRMKDFSFSLFSLKNAQVLFETDNLDFKKKLKVDIRQNIYLIFKEAMNNAAKYSKSEQIKVSLRNSDGNFIMTIIDPCSDFSPQKLTGHGLKNMQMRAKRIGGEIEFIKEDGFKISFKRQEL